jgi:hypothetical protein
MLSCQRCPEVLRHLARGSGHEAPWLILYSDAEQAAQCSGRRCGMPLAEDARAGRDALAAGDGRRSARPQPKC